MRWFSAFFRPIKSPVITSAVGIEHIRVELPPAAIMAAVFGSFDPAGSNENVVEQRALVNGFLGRPAERFFKRCFLGFVCWRICITRFAPITPIVVAKLTIRVVRFVHQNHFTPTIGTSRGFLTLHALPFKFHCHIWSAEHSCCATPYQHSL